MHNQSVKMGRERLFKTFIYIVLGALALSILLPLAWVFMASIKENAEFYGNAWALPAHIHWQNFADAWNKAKMGEYFLNSVLSTGLGILILLLISVPCAYTLTRMSFRGQKFLNQFLRAGLFINLSYIVIPIFLMLRSWDNGLKKLLGLRRFEFFLNNIWILALIYAATALPFTIYLLSNYFRSISKTYEEAAYIDGAGYLRTMLKIIVPMARPSIITVILFNFLGFWNEYILALTLLPGKDSKTLPVGLINLMQAQRGAANYGPLYAGLVMVMLPTLILYIIVQKRLTEGMMVGGDKG
ncbi:MAG: carbohydrate ABC transporter permease [Clostridiales bacterium]|nr:carbohydrate ABC transporter permease [Clostridiales bacterium]MDD7432581.1 carbohydrate ABC transporter permease [Clostridiales bacterium]MDY3062158.1 carbohydrate ABC transporter permease [Eubacteriales bacterium]